MPASPKTDNALNLLAVVGERGLTWQELAAATGSHHGSSSAMLSTLHKHGRIARLAERRGGSSVYVALDQVAGRELGARRQAKSSEVADVAGAGAGAGAGAANHTVDVEALLAAQAALAELQGAADAALAAARAEDRHLEQIEKLRAELKAHEDESRRRYTAKQRTADQQHDLEKVKIARSAEKEGRAAGEAVGWQDGYDQGVRRGQESATGDDAFLRGRDVGRLEGEDVMRRRVHAVSSEMFKVITENTPLRAHFKGCYVIHPECTVKALGKSAGITTARPMPLSRVV